jgi:hypothetical protein
MHVARSNHLENMQVDMKRENQVLWRSQRYRNDCVTVPACALLVQTIGTGMNDNVNQSGAALAAAGQEWL